jgi:hypothetical protein
LITILVWASARPAPPMPPVAPNANVAAPARRKSLRFMVVSSLDVLFVVAGIDTRHPQFLE